MKSLLIALVAFVAVNAQAQNQVERCLTRIANSCHLSVSDAVGAVVNVEECKQIARGTEGLVLRNGTVTVINTDSCYGDQYRFPGGRIEKSKSIRGKLYLLGAGGRVFFVHNNGWAYEVKNSKDESYRSVVDIKGGQGGSSIVLELANNQTFEIDEAKLVEKVLKGQVDPVRPRRVTGKSLFW
jgi:hypothetical protein